MDILATSFWLVLVLATNINPISKWRWSHSLSGSSTGDSIENFDSDVTQSIAPMAKKRERQVGRGGRRPKDPFAVAASSRADRAADSASNRKLVTIFILLCVVLIPALAVLLYYVKKAAPLISTASPEHLRGLVKPDVTYQEILSEHSKILEDTSLRHYTYPVLAYITPWNSKGYEMAKRFNSKFTHLSPVWYDLKSQGSSVVLEGRHNADAGWLSALRRAGEALVVPRVVLEAVPRDLLTKKKLREKAINLILTECKEMGYDGIVLESWSRWTAYGILFEPDLRKKALAFVKQLGHALHSVTSARNSKQHLQLIYVIGPASSETLQAHDFGPEDLQSLSDAVDGFSLMTYDFSSPHNPGPNAPLQWIRFTLQLLLGSLSQDAQGLAQKIFVGINFYGNDYLISEAGEGGGGPIIGRDYLNLLEKHQPALQWEKKSGEHFFSYHDDNHARHAVFYPSLLSISLRLEEARLRGTGISIWEIGQGLDYFFDLL